MIGVGLLAAVLSLSGCAEYKFAADEAKASGFTDSSATGGSDDTGAVDDLATPGWFAISAQLAVQDGLALSGSGSVHVEIVAEDGAEVLCEASLLGDWSGAGGDEDVALWWSFATQDAVLCAELPQIHLGIGPLLPDIRARLGAAGMDGVSASLYGAYVSTASGAPSAPDTFGYAARPEDLDGSGTGALPLADGTYTLTPLYLIAL